MAKSKQPKGWKVVPLYRGKVKLGFDQWGNKTGRRHSYWINVEKSAMYPRGAKMIPGVTGICGVLTVAAGGLAPWAARQAVSYLRNKQHIEITDDTAQNAVMAHARFRDNAGVRGTSVHKYSERLINSEKLTRGERNTAACKRAIRVIKLLKKEGIEVVACEQTIFSREHEYCGTLDLDCTYNGEPVILDIKTSSGFRAGAALQLAAYAFARQEEYPKRKFVNAGVILAGSQCAEIKWLSDEMQLPGKEALAACHNAFLGLMAVRTSMPNLATFGFERK